ncbi:proline-rich receptor-like protein kinase PERK3 [Tasmannia lanceolata]|uniref:proline-rich receptor-like protein kinase PERK3 n=1 Tax=Tasmannia lanceolata TaxID=3420 RepID=UPI00406419E7
MSLPRNLDFVTRASPSSPSLLTAENTSASPWISIPMRTVVIICVLIVAAVTGILIRCYKKRWQRTHRLPPPPDKDEQSQNGHHIAPPSSLASTDTHHEFDETSKLSTLHPIPPLSFISKPSHVVHPRPQPTNSPPPWLPEYTTPTTSTSSSSDATSFTSKLPPRPIPPQQVTLRSSNEDSTTYHTATDTISTFTSSGEKEDVFPSNERRVFEVETMSQPLRWNSAPAFPYPSQPSHAPSLLPPPADRSRRSRPNRARSDNQLQPSPSSIGTALSFSRVTLFSYEELAKVTNEFSAANLLGQGGFGSVHKGTLANGIQVAIKQLKAGSGQGDREFQAEVEIISRVHHKHLVSLVGYCIAEERRILVYEFVPNNTLKFHLHGSGITTMEWSSRVKVALGSAKGLAYLHEDCHPKIIHRDIKSDNVLLDLNCEAKIADFGLAKIFPDDNTYIEVTRVMGTFGYLDPECFLTQKFTERSDVFAFGVMVLELITGRQAVMRTQSSGVYSLVEWAKPLMEAHNYHVLVDPRLEANYDVNDMTRVVDCAAACVRASSRSRPKMSQIVRVLEGHLSLNVLNEGITVSRASTFNHIESSSLGSPTPLP